MYTQNTTNASDKSRHTSARDTAIPGKDQGPYSNDSTMPATNQRHILQAIIIRFLVLARNDNLAISAIL